MLHASRPTRITLLGALFCLCVAMADAAAGPVGTVTGHAGDAFAVGPLGSRKLHNGRTVFAGDMLVTAGGAWLQVALRDGTRLALAGDSRFALPTIDREQVDGGRLNLYSHLRGTVRVSLPAATTPPRRLHRLRVPHATIEMHAGDLTCGADPDGNGTLLELHSGDAIMIRTPTQAARRFAAPLTLRAAGDGLNILHP